MKQGHLILSLGFILLLQSTLNGWAAEEVPLSYHYPLSADECGSMYVWDVSMAMCMPLPMADMPMKMVMLRGNGFGTYISGAGPRGRDAFAGPNMVMLDLGTTLGDRHYLNLDIMGTLEKWTFPDQGYPLLLQVGESNGNGIPFIDAQHPHSSPIMGLTVSDTIKLETGREKDHLKIFFAPRGESTDGPIAFMHRPTGIANPDAPLGHHVGQDVGHISSTVIGASLNLNHTRFEVSTFNGQEPEPTQIDLPVDVPNSYSLRLIEDFSSTITGMVSAAYVKDPEHDDPSIPFVTRYSASLYTRHTLKQWHLYNAFIFGLITQYAHAASLASFGEEFWLHNSKEMRIFGRLEVIQRTPHELEIAASDPNSGRWVVATTVGYTHAITQIDEGEIGIGASVTKDFLPTDYQGTYGGNPWTGKLFLQFSGMKMSHY